MIFILINLGHNFHSSALAVSTKASQPIQHNVIPNSTKTDPIYLNTETAAEIYHLTLNYTSFGSRPGTITITKEGPNRVLFSPMIGAKGRNSIAPIYPSWKPTGPGGTNSFSLLDNGEKFVNGSYAAKGTRWCVVFSQGDSWVKVNSGHDVPVSMLATKIKPSCVNGL